MLCLPEFDTYRILPAYARNPDDRYNQLALHLLKHRTLAALQWRVLNCRILTDENADNLLKFQMGRWGRGKKQSPVLDISKMNSEELLDFYMKAVESVGQHVDPSLFTKKKETSDGNKSEHNNA